MLTAAARKNTFLQPDTESWRQKNQKHQKSELLVSELLLHQF